jgi:HlyD family secretion protein
MDGADFTVEASQLGAMDRKVHRPSWHWLSWPLSVRVAAAMSFATALGLALLIAIFGNASRSLRVPLSQVTVSSVERELFRDFIPLRASVVPRDTIYLDAVEGGNVERVLVEPGDNVVVGQPLIELGNTNLQLQVIQQESQLNQAISQLQQNEIALEQNKITNERALAEIDFNVVRLERSMQRREALVMRGAAASEDLDRVADELAHYRRLKPIQTDSSKRQEELRGRLLPDIRDQLDRLRANLTIVRGKLDNLIVRSPSAGRVTAIDLKIGENRGPGQRLAEITPETGVKLSAVIDEFYIGRVRNGLGAVTEIGSEQIALEVVRVHPQVRDGRFEIDLSFKAEAPASLVPGQTLQVRLALGQDVEALILPAGPFLTQTGGAWAFVLTADGGGAERRAIKIGRRSAEQVEVLAGLVARESVITSAYNGLDRIDRIILTK